MAAAAALVVCVLSIAPGPANGTTGTRYLDRVFDEVEVSRDVAYRPPLDELDVTYRLDVYEPVGDTLPRRPLVVWLHGAPGEKSQPFDVYMSTMFAEHGAVAASIDYRPGADGASDAREAVRFLGEHADEYGIDTDRIVVAGVSAGAMTAMDAVYLPDVQRAPPPPHPTAAAVSLAGSGPRDAVQRGEPPVFMAHGRDDTTVPHADAVAFCAAADAAGVRCDLTPYDAGHIDLFVNIPEIEALLWVWLADVLSLATAQDPTTTVAPPTTPTTAPAAPTAPTASAPVVSSTPPHFAG